MDEQADHLRGAAPSSVPAHAWSVTTAPIGSTCCRLLVATDGAITAFGYDGRRLRPNLVIGGVAGLDERTWAGRYLRIGDVVVALESLRGRCVMTTFDPDTLEQDLHVLRSIVDRFGGRLALNASVVRGGHVRENDNVELVSRNEYRHSVGPFGSPARRSRAGDAGAHVFHGRCSALPTEVGYHRPLEDAACPYRRLQRR